MKYHRLQGGGFVLRLVAGLIGNAADFKRVLTDAVLTFHQYQSCQSSRLPKKRQRPNG